MKVTSLTLATNMVAKVRVSALVASFTFVSNLVSILRST
jgi:hypothetical protein